MKRKLDEKWLKPYDEWTPEMKSEFPLPKPIAIVFVPENIEEILIEEIEKEKKMEVKATIELRGELPKKYMNRLKKVSKRIKDDASEMFGEYEIWGEFFGDDPEVYALFLTDVKVEKA